MWTDHAEPDLLWATSPLISPAFEGEQWEQATLRLGDEARLLLYTDGVTEANGADGMFGRSRMLEIVRQFPRGGDCAAGSHFEGRARPQRRPTTERRSHAPYRNDFLKKRHPSAVWRLYVPATVP